MSSDILLTNNTCSVCKSYFKNDYKGPKKVVVSSSSDLVVDRYVGGTNNEIEGEIKTNNGMSRYYIIVSTGSRRTVTEVTEDTFRKTFT